eukprot:snap_masked-scaffold426_size175065-processed-gene-0.12 protein:Tk08639 transcript:snap_masked-scaffold426_size175065-processed-gene-0.12-mRNA-1 annotation:"hypothetical protein DAPPUDRAFT_52553"
MDPSDLLTKEQRLVELSEDFFEKRLPKKGKPKLGEEWTIYSSIIVEDTSKDALEIVACGTGSKCLGQHEVSANGDLVHDSHAEVMAKRAFRRYLLDQIRSPRESSIFKEDWVVKDHVQFHFLSTHPPCGDGSIALRDADEPEAKKAKLDLHRTGAKCLEGEVQDQLGSGTDYHTALGAIRTKPGRGDPTLSLSCSDKLVKWNFLGWQGAMLASLLPQPVLMTSMTFYARPCFEASIARALKTRLPEKIQTKARIRLLDRTFAWGKDDSLHPSSCSIVACRTQGQMAVEVVVDGRKQGCIKKHYGTSKARSAICRLALAQECLSSLQAQSPLLLPLKVQEMLLMAIYLDHNATCPLAPEVSQGIHEACLNIWGNPSSSHASGKKAKEAVDKARSQLANMIGSRQPEEITFVSGGTEANYLAMHSAIQSFKSAHPQVNKPHVISSNIEHVATTLPLMNGFQPIVDGLVISKLRYGLPVFGQVRFQDTDPTHGNMKKLQGVLNDLMRLVANKRISDKISCVDLSEMTGIPSLNRICASATLKELKRASDLGWPLADVLEPAKTCYGMGLRSQTSKLAQKCYN